MRPKFLVTILLLAILSSAFGLTGFGVSDTFAVTEDTLSVVLSSFTAQSTAQNYNRLPWARHFGYLFYPQFTRQIKYLVFEILLLFPQLRSLDNNRRTLLHLTRIRRFRAVLFSSLTFEITRDLGLFE